MLSKTAVELESEDKTELSKIYRNLFGLVDPELKVNLDGVKEEDLKAIENVLHLVSSGVDATVTADDDKFEEVMRVVRLLKTHRWLTPDSEARLKVG